MIKNSQDIIFPCQTIETAFSPKFILDAKAQNDIFGRYRI